MKHFIKSTGFILFINTKTINIKSGKRKYSNLQLKQIPAIREVKYAYCIFSVLYNFIIMYIATEYVANAYNKEYEYGVTYETSDGVNMQDAITKNDNIVAQI